MQHIKKQRQYFADKGLSSQSYHFSSSHVWMWELDYKESWTQKNWCFWTVVLKTLESPLDSKKIKPVNPKGNQPRIFIGRTDAEAGPPILRSSDSKNWFFGKDPDGWEWVRARGKGGDSGWDDWTASLTQWTRVWANSSRQWRTGKPGVLQFMGSQRVGHDLVTEQQGERRAKTSLPPQGLTALLVSPSLNLLWKINSLCCF